MSNRACLFKLFTEFRSSYS